MQLLDGTRGFLATCSLAEGLEWSGFTRLYVEVAMTNAKGETKVRKIPVGLNILVKSEVELRDALESGLGGSLGGGVACLELLEGVSGEGLRGVSEGVPPIYKKVTLEDLANTPEVDGVVVLLDVSEKSPRGGLRELENICSSRKDVRVVGGRLLETKGVRVGRWAKESEESENSLIAWEANFLGKGGFSSKNRRVVWDEVWDEVTEVALEDIKEELQGRAAPVKKVRVRREPKPRKEKGERRKEANKPKAPNKKVVTFDTLFGEVEDNEF